MGQYRACYAQKKTLQYGINLTNTDPQRRKKKMMDENEDPWASLKFCLQAGFKEDLE